MIRILIILLFFSFSLSADQYDSRLEKLFDQLLKTDDENKIDKITISIWDIWHETNDPKINADFFRGLGLMNMGHIEKSIYYFSKVIDKNPNFAEAWNKRATAYYMLGKYDQSMIDINATLKLEPRHFGALDGMTLIFIHQKKYNKAVKIYDEIIKIFPKSKLLYERRKNLLNLITQST